MNFKNKSFVLFLILGFAILLFKSSGIYPVVADELVYSQASRLLPISESGIPGYLYLIVYKYTNYCGDGFLNCARILNSLFFVLTAPFIYAITKRVASNATAIIIACLAVIGPINSYTIYFMPEAFYFFSFWVFSWYALRSTSEVSILNWAIVGVLIGISSLIKPHALFLIPAVIFYIFYVNKNDFRFIGITKCILFFLSGVFFAKLILGYMIAGKAGITIFGSSYSAAAVSTATNYSRYLELIKLATENIAGHLLTISAIYGLPLAYAVYEFITATFSKNSITNQQRIAVFLILVLGTLLTIVGLFTASVANSGPYETVTRLHMRYYNFALPLFLVMIATIQSAKVDSLGSRRLRAIIALPIAFAILYAGFTRFKDYRPDFIDAPDLIGFISNPKLFLVLCTLSLFSVCLWAYKQSFGGKSFLYVYAPLLMIGSSYYLNLVLTDHRYPDEYDRAAVVMKKILNPGQLSKLHVVGSDPGLMNLTLFQLDNANTSFSYIPEGAAFDVDQIPKGKEWLLLIGKHEPIGGLTPLNLNGFSLIKASTNLDFKDSTWPGVVQKIQGISFPEPIGVWSVGKEIEIEFSSPLPAQFNLELRAYAFGPNIGKDITLSVGGTRSVFQLAGAPENVMLLVKNPNSSNILQIKIPDPTSPKQIGLNDDDRMLGIALQNIKITPIQAK